MDRKQKMDLFTILLILGVLIFMGLTYQFMISNGKECLVDPLSYFESKNEGAVCNCWKEGQAYRETDISFIFNLDP
jgi:hypothetical protein